MRRVELKLTNIASDGHGSRRGRNNTYADLGDLLRSRADILSGRDKALINMYFEKGSSFSQMARIARVNETTIARRVHKLIRRLLDSEYTTCLRNRDRFSQFEQAVARDYFIVGLSQEKIAKKRNVTIYHVRKSIRVIRKQIRAIEKDKSLKS